MAIKELVELVSRVTDMERRMASVMRHGTVAEVDPGKQRVRINFGPAHGGEGEFLSPWIPYAQFSGALRVHTPPTVGQQLTAMSPTGDFQQAVAVPLTHHNANPSPSTEGDENVITYGNVRMTLADDLVLVDAGGSIFKMTGAEIRLETNGSSIVLNGAGVTVNGARIDLN